MSITGQKHDAKLSIVTRPARPTPKPTASPTPKPTAQPTAKPLHSVVSVLPRTTLPNQDISVSGTGFPANATVTVNTTIDLRGGGNRALSKSVFADSNGNFSTSLRVPFKAAQGTYTVTRCGVQRARVQSTYSSTGERTPEQSQLPVDIAVVPHRAPRDL